MTWLNAPSGKKAERLPVRAAEHNVTMPGAGGPEQVSQTCTIITTLLDHQTAPADEVRDAHLTRWSAAETTFGQDKATITGAGNRTSGPVLRSGSPRTVIQEAWAWLTATQLVRTSGAAALRSEHAAARACLHTFNLPRRQRHSQRAQKARPKFPHATATKTTATGKPQVTVFAPGSC